MTYIRWNVSSTHLKYIYDRLPLEGMLYHFEGHIIIRHLKYSIVFVVVHMRLLQLMMILQDPPLENSSAIDLLVMMCKLKFYILHFLHQYSVPLKVGYANVWQLFFMLISKNSLHFLIDIQCFVRTSIYYICR